MNTAERHGLFQRAWRWFVEDKYQRPEYVVPDEEEYIDTGFRLVRKAELPEADVRIGRLTENGIVWERQVPAALLKPKPKPRKPRNHHLVTDPAQHPKREQIATLYQAGNSTMTIARELHLSRTTVSKVLRAAGVPIRGTQQKGA